MPIRKTIYFLAVSFLVLCSCEKNPGAQSETSDGSMDYVTLQSKSPKRGVSFNFGQLPDNDIPLLGPACSWSYNWGGNTSGQAFSLFSEYGMDFCPMAWNANWSEDNFRTFKAQHPECQYILAYNEPNLTDQANMTPSKAAEDWPRLVAIARELGMKIIAPAMNYGTLDGYHDPWKWYDEFFAQPGVSLDDIDGIALHCYMGSAHAMKSFVDQSKKYGKPVWLTEFCNWANNNISAEAQMSYMVEAINLLEADSDVFRYAWFIPRGNGDAQCHNSLLQSAKPFGLTDLGKVFVNMSTQDKSLYYKPGDVVPAEHYTSVQGDIHLAPCSDTKGILELRDLKKGATVHYQIEVPQDGTYAFEFRYHTFFPSPMSVILDNRELGVNELENTDYQWKNSKVDIPLTKGRHVFSLTGTTGFPITLNWFRFEQK